MKKLTAIDLFAGAGGLGLGLEWAGFQVLAANEVDPVIAEAYRLNHPETTMITGDISSPEVEQAVIDEGGKVDLVAGGPPCQGFSTVGSKKEADPRNQLFQAFLSVVRQTRPRAVLFENVSGFKRLYQGRIYKALISELEGLGYHLHHAILNAVDFGVPQYRQRTFVVGFESPTGFQFPVPTHSGEQSLFGDQSYMTLGEALSDLPEVASGEEAAKYAGPAENTFQSTMRGRLRTLTEHVGPTHGDKLMEVIRHVPPGGTIKDVPEHLHPKSCFANTYARLWWDRPSTTITRNLGTPSSSRCIHPYLDRGLTTREGARLQGFPDNYLFVGSRSQKNLQIGNAVPPLLAEAIGRQLVSAIVGETEGKAVVA